MTSPISGYFSLVPIFWILTCRMYPILPGATADPQHNIRIVWWQYPPYIFVNESLGSGSQDVAWGEGLDGVFRVTLDKLFTHCGILQNSSMAPGVNITLEQQENSWDFPQHQEEHRALSSTVVYLGVLSSPGKTPLLMKSVDPRFSMVFLEVLRTPGSVHFYKKEELPVGSDLLTVIIQGWPLLVLILLGAGYSGIIIWLLVSTSFYLAETTQHNARFSG